MNNPIKRVWVPKKTNIAPTNPVDSQNAPMQPLKMAAYFDGLPEPDVEEKTSDSVWAAFETEPSTTDGKP